MIEFGDLSFLTGLHFVAMLKAAKFASGFHLMSARWSSVAALLLEPLRALWASFPVRALFSRAGPQRAS